MGGWLQGESSAVRSFGAGQTEARKIMVAVSISRIRYISLNQVVASSAEDKSVAKKPGVES